MLYHTEAMLPDASSHTARSSFMRLAAAAVGFGCLFAYSRLLALGFDGLIDFGSIASADEFYLARSVARILTIALLMVLGLNGRFTLSVKTIVAACAAMAVTTILFTLGDGGVLGALVALVAGAANGVLLFAWCLVLCHQSAREIIGTTVAALLMAGVVLMGAPALDSVACLVMLTAVALAAGAGIFAIDPKLQSFQADKPISRSELTVLLGEFPWFSIVLVIACGILGTVFYGIATTLFWNVGDPANYAVLGLSVAATIASTALIILKARAWMRLVWLPSFVLLLAGLLFSCLAGPDLREVSIALLLSSVFCYHFMRWMIFPCMIGVARAPRVLLCGLLLIVTNNFLTSHAGEMLAGALPENMRDIGDVAFLLCLALVVLFAVATALSQHPTNTSSSQSKQTTSEDSFEDVFNKAADRCSLTNREREIALLTAKGRSSTYIANELVIASSTVRFHQQNAYRKLDVHSREELIDLVDDWRTLGV